MGIIGQRPESGVRIDVERPHTGGPPWQYRGTAATSDLEIALNATIDAEGEVRVELGGAGNAELAEKVRLLLRAAFKHSAENDLPPARRIQRWRGEGGR